MSQRRDGGIDLAAGRRRGIWVTHYACITVHLILNNRTSIAHAHQIRFTGQHGFTALGVQQCSPEGVSKPRGVQHQCADRCRCVVCQTAGAAGYDRFWRGTQCTCACAPTVRAKVGVVHPFYATPNRANTTQPMTCMASCALTFGWWQLAPLSMQLSQNCFNVFHPACL